VSEAPLNAFTVDLEEWFHICGGPPVVAEEHWVDLPSRIRPTTHILLDLLDGAGVRATFFVVGWIAERYPDLIQDVIAAGHEIGSHGHLHRRVFELGREHLVADVKASVAALQAAGVGDVTLFRAPEWSINDRSLWALDLLVGEGFLLDASMAPVHLVGSPSYPRYPHVRNTEGGQIVEAPPLVGDRFGQAFPFGWGWGLRMSSPRRVLRAIERMNRQDMPAVLMVHPWELDPDPPRVRLSARLHFAHYFCLRGFITRLRQLLSSAGFGPIGRMATSGQATRVSAIE
jgi:polysaccharide deacetylase family protein (PEP-CTERM system associated)